MSLALLALAAGCSGEPTPDDDTAGATSTPEDSPTPGPTDTPSGTSTPSSPTPVDTPTDTPETATPTPEPLPTSYSALIRRTGHGIVHVLADDLGSVSFGQAYAFAEDHACVLADQIVKVRSERSKFFGPGPSDANLNNDFTLLALHVYRNAENGFSQLSPASRSMLRGYAAGYNRYLEDVGIDGLPSDCAGAAWIRPISEIDLLAYYLSMALLSSGTALAPGIIAATPPAPETPTVATSSLPPFPDLRHPELGSNGWAIGRDKTESGGGMVAVNPHFPWEGELKLHEEHLTVPGELNVYGASLMGTPIVEIGFNENVGWTHTVTSACHMTGYRLSLIPGNPYRYRYDNGSKEITGETYSIDVLQEDGSYQTTARTLYRSHYGPMIALEGYGWSETQAFTFRDANENNLVLIEQFLRMSQAGDLNDFKSTFVEVGGIPWVHTMAADRDGNTFYVDASAVPNLSQQAIGNFLADLRTDQLTAYAWDLGIALLDGSESSNEWVVEPGARPGLVPFYAMPQLDRTDFVANANDNHWLTNPAEPLEEFSPLYLEDRTPRAPRTRMNLVALTETGKASSAGADEKFSLDEVQAAVLSNRGIMAELLQVQVAERCTGETQILYEGTLVNIEEACATLYAWDGLTNLDSAGAAVWREFIGTFEDADLYDAGLLFEVPFDPENPVNTPNTLAAAPSSGTDPILQNLAAAVSRLKLAEIPVDAELGSIQFTLKGDEVIPMHGGQGFEGVGNIVVYSTGLNSTLLPRMPRAEVINSRTDLTADGYLVNYGSSFVMVLEYTPEGPRARAFVTYSQSEYSSSPWFSDQTHMFSDKDWRDVRFTEDDIAADPDLVSYEVGTED